MSKNLLIIAFLLLCSRFSICADILYFNQDCNTDLAGADNTCQDERFNLLNIITAAGENSTLLSSFHDPSLATKLSANDFLLIPDLEDATCSSGMASFITTAEKLVLANYVNNGGRILIAGSPQNVNFINDIFSLSISIAPPARHGGSSLKNISAASGTPFEKCSNTIDNFSATFLINSSLPSSKQCIYEDAADASVAFFKVGSGGILYLGYDFNDAGIGCTQSMIDWVNCIFTSAIEVGEFGILGAPKEVPTMSEWNLLILMLSMLIFGIVALFQFRIKSNLILHN